MKTHKEDRDCRSCGNTEHLIIRNIPAETLVTSGDKKRKTDFSVCGSCGSVEELPYDNAEVLEAEIEYLKYLVEREIISEEEANIDQTKQVLEQIQN